GAARQVPGGVRRARGARHRRGPGAGGRRPRRDRARVEDPRARRGEPGPRRQALAGRDAVRGALRGLTMDRRARPLEGRRIVLGVAGGIAAYKAAELVRLLTSAGAEVRVVMTPAASEFVGELPFQVPSGHPVHPDLFDLTQESEIGHIKLADQAELVIVAPATADLVARLAAGMGDDLLATIVLATKAPVLLAPSM